jgi:hypothetical protein
LTTPTHLQAHLLFFIAHINAKIIKRASKPTHQDTSKMSRFTCYNLMGGSDYNHPANTLFYGVKEIDDLETWWKENNETFIEILQIEAKRII